MTHYIDPNSGAAPQPGGYAGEHAVPLGHGPVPETGLEEDKSQLNVGEAPVEQPTFQEEAERLTAASGEGGGNPDLARSLSRPDEVLAEEDEGNSASTYEAGASEEEASDAKALETEGVDLQGVGENPDGDPAGDADADADADANDGDGDGDGDSAGDGDGAGDAGDAYDPSEHGVDEVKAYVAEHPGEKAAILAAEKNGKNRSTLVSALEG